MNFILLTTAGDGPTLFSIQHVETITPSGDNAMVFVNGEKYLVKESLDEVITKMTQCGAGVVR